MPLIPLIDLLSHGRGQQRDPGAAGMVLQPATTLIAEAACISLQSGNAT